MNNACMLSAPKKTDFVSKVSEGKKNKIINNNSDKFKEEFEKLLNEDNVVDNDSNVTNKTEDLLNVVENKETTKEQNKVNINETLSISLEEIQEDNETVIIVETPFIVSNNENNEVDTSITTNNSINETNDITVNEEIKATHYLENSFLNNTNTDKTEINVDTKTNEIYFESTSAQLENMNVLHINKSQLNNLNVNEEKLNTEFITKEESNLIKPETTNTLINEKINAHQEGNTFKLNEEFFSKEVELSSKESETKDSLTKKNVSNEFEVLLNSNEETDTAKIEGMKETNTGFDLLQDNNTVLKSNNIVETITNDSNDFLDEVTDKEFSIIQQMAKNITTSKLENGSKITVKLKPEYLGEMTISIESDNNSFVAKISSGREDIKKILNSKVDEISSLLSQKMIKVDRIIVDSIQQDGHMDSNTGHEAGRENMFERNFAQQNNSSNKNSNNVNLQENESIKEPDLNETNSKDGINYYV